ncbi:MAG: hypothetical protein JWM68_2215 [Verrucomicrobiales bacterium]|nr:hypothetical protein [Verrucomicrobiales bacterium]
MNPQDQFKLLMTRRQFFGRSVTGIGAAALASILNQDLFGAAGVVRKDSMPLPGLPHFAPKAKRIIYLMQSGAPSHIDLFNYKPGLEKYRGQEIPASVTMGQRLTTMTGKQANKSVLPSITKFAQHGRNGTWISDFLPHTASIVDDICIVKSMFTEAINHAPAVTFFLTGSEMPGRPSMGSWLTYGLGCENENLPAFVVMTSRDKENSCGQIFYDYYWGSGFLPSKYQGVKFRGEGDPVLYLSNPAGMSTSVRRGILDDLAQLNEIKQKEMWDPEIATRISQYEMAYRMQASVPELSDLSTEPESTFEAYGPESRRPGSYARNCILARRLAEKGVRFIHLLHAGWDQHKNLPTQLKIQCTDTDQPSAALIKDLKQRGLLEDTLVVWGGEFGRTPFCQGDPAAKEFGRDHHPRCFSLWMAGAGVKPGISFGETDDYAHNVVKDPVHVHDLQATILGQMGIDHTKLTYKFQGRHFRLTDVHGKAVQEILT